MDSTGDRLQQMFEAHQFLVDGVLRIPHAEALSPDSDSFDSLLQASLGMVCESAEVIDALNTVSKPWKQVPFASSLSHAKEEMIDTLFYLIEYCLVAGIGPEELLNAFMRKQYIVMGRVLKADVPPAILVRTMADLDNAVALLVDEERGIDYLPILKVLVARFPILREPAMASAFALSPDTFIRGLL